MSWQEATKLFEHFKDEPLRTPNRGCLHRAAVSLEMPGYGFLALAPPSWR